MTLEESKVEIQDIIDIYEKEDMYPLLNDRQISALKVAISALQAQDSEIRRCDTCKHDPPSKKWPCVDCDMRKPADRWEVQDVPDTNVGKKTCKTCHLWEDGELNIACPGGSNYEHYEDDYCSLWEKQN